jgi:hypothetical protein
VLNEEKPPETPPKNERVSNVAVDRVRRCRRKPGSRLVSVAVLRVGIATPRGSRGRAVEADVPAKRTRAADGGGGNSGGADGDGDAGGVVDGVVDGDAGASSLGGGRETFDDRRPPVSACRTRCRCSRSLEKESCPLLFFLFSASTSRLGTDVHTSQ